MTARAVHWHEGMFLRPQQFQAAERHAHEVLARSGRWDVHHGWGARRVEWEADALATYRFALSRLEARFRDGTTLVLPEDGSLPALDLKPVFAKSNRVTVYVAVPQLRLGHANAAADGSRYRTDLLELEDENTGVNPQPVSVLLPTVRLLTDADDLTGFDTLPLARIEKSARAE